MWPPFPTLYRCTLTASLSLSPFTCVGPSPPPNWLRFFFFFHSFVSFFLPSYLFTHSVCYFLLSFKNFQNGLRPLWGEIKIIWVAIARTSAEANQDCSLKEVSQGGNEKRILLILLAYLVCLRLSISLWLMWKQQVVLGDSNLDSYQHSNTTVLFNAKGRLSHFHNIFRSITGPFTNVSTVLICLSTLDKRNTSFTNTSTLKSLLGSLRRVFPRCKIFILACGIDSRFTEDQKSSCSSLNSFVCSKNPSSCFFIPAVSPFVCEEDVWNNSTKTQTFDLISSYLN